MSCSAGTKTFRFRIFARDVAHHDDIQLKPRAIGIPENRLIPSTENRRFDINPQPHVNLGVPMPTKGIWRSAWIAD
jgi:hypothetical protein